MTKNIKENIFSVKRETDEILSGVALADFPFSEMEERARRLSEIGDRALPFVSGFLKKTKDPLIVERILHIIELLNDCSYTSVLKDLLLGENFRTTPLKVKVEILATLKSYDANLPGGSGHLIFDKPEDAFMLWVRRVLEDFDDREYRVISLIEELLFSGAKKSHLIKKIGTTFGAEAAKLFVLLAVSDNREISSAAIKYLGTVKDDSSVLALREIISDSWDRDIIQDAEKALRRLQFSGFDIRRAKYEPANLPAEKFKAFASPVDSIGNINLCCSLERDDNRSEALFLVLNNDTGIIDIFGSKNMRNDDLSNMLDEIRDDALLAEVEMDYAISLINDCIHKNEKNKIPLPPEFHYRKRLFRGMINPGEYVPSFSLNLIRDAIKDEKLLAMGGSLFEMKEFEGWVLSTPRAFDYAEKLLLLKSKNNPMLSVLKEKELVRDFCADIMTPMKGRLKRRLLHMADFLMRSDGCRQQAHIALATAFSIRKRGNMELSDIPFLNVMAEKSMEHCAEAINDGFDLRDFCDDQDELED